LVITGIASLNFAARRILGEQFYYCPVAIVFLKDATSLPRETLVSMRSIFDKDPEARKDMKVFLEHLKPGDAEHAQDVRDMPAAEKAAAADPEVLDAIAIANAAYEAVKPRASKGTDVIGAAAIEVAAREILGKHHNCQVASRFLSIQNILSRESLVEMRTIFDSDPAARTVMGTFLKRFAFKRDDNAASGPREYAAMDVEK